MQRGHKMGTITIIASRCLLGTFLSVALIHLVASAEDSVADTPSYKVPDPFASVPADKQDEYYLIRSTQSAYSSHKQNEKLEVEEYFSLGAALSYSIHRKQADKQRAWALIGDGKYGRWYVLSNPDSIEPDELGCELDQVHSHRQVFPWQYIYDLAEQTNGGQSTLAVDPFPGLLPEPTNKQRRRKKRTNNKRNNKNDGRRKSFIYGVGAIWLNAIKGDVRSTLVGARSPYQLSNSWVLESERIRVELMFDKLDKHEGDAIEIQRQLDRQPLTTVKIDRKHLVESATSSSLPSATASVDTHSEYIVIDEFKSGLNKENSRDLLERLQVQLDFCRRTNQRHRIFPSLLRALSSSPQRIYELIYTAKYMQAFRDDGVAHNGAYNKERHRYLHSLETVREFLSLSARTEMIVYEPVNEREPGHGIDVFISRFADKPTGQRSTRHSSRHFHMFIAGESETCELGVREPHSKHHLLQRPFRFHELGQEHLAHIRGLGALLMNVADWPYKSFSVAGKKIKVGLEPGEEREIETDELLVEDRHSGWRISLFIERRNRALETVSWDLTERARADLSRLVRVDVRDMRAVDMAEDTITTSTSENKNDDYDLLFQYTIGEINFRLSEDELELFTSVPDVCKEVIESQQQQQAENSNSNSDSDSDSDSNDQDNVSYDKDYHDHNDDDDTSSDADSTDGGQDEGEQFEFEPGELHENFPLPDFLDFLEDETTYSFTVKLELVDGDTDPDDIGQDDKTPVAAAKGKHIWLSEVVDLKSERASLSVFNTDEAYKRAEPDERYLVLYESELLFKLTRDRCEHVSEPDNKWLRLLSTRWVYFTLANYAGQKTDQTEEVGEESAQVQSSQLSLFGVGALWRHASEGSMAEYLGKRREIVERDGKQYRQLVWLVSEFDMAVRFNFLMEEQGSQANKRPAGRAARNTPERVLRLDSIIISNELDDGLVATHFKQVRVSIESFAIGPDRSKALDLPASCRSAWYEAQRGSAQIQPTPATPPSMYDLLGGQHNNGYSMTYIITHTANIHQADLETGEKSASMLVVERFDRARNRASIRVTFKTQPVDIYIEGESRRIYAYIGSELGQCASIDSIGPIFKALMGDLLIENRAFEREKMYGLAGIINELATKSAQVSTETHLDTGGRKEEKRTYRLRWDEVPKSDGASGKTTALDVAMVVQKERPHLAANGFDHAAKARVRTEDRLRLRSISLRPSIRQTKSQKLGIRRLEKSTLVYLVHQSTLNGEDWTLPQACQDLQVQPDGSSSSSIDNEQPAQTRDEFPKLGSLLARINSFHMRSEVTIQGKVNKVYLLDEWLHNGHLRMHSRGLGKSRENNFDFIIYTDTREQFDLSEPLACKSNHFPSDVRGTTPTMQTLLDVLLDESAQVDQLASLYYGPLALWRLADRYLDGAKLIRSIEISLAHLDTADSFRAQIGREMRKEIWQISAPSNSRHTWKYSLEFHKYSKQEEEEGGAMRVLNSIQVEDLENTRILVDIVNYNYEPNSNDMLELFRLPEGWGCQRTPTAFDSYHEFALDWRSSWYLTYEASLELIDPSKSQIESEDPELGRLAGANLGERVKLPTLSGSYMRNCPSETRDPGRVSSQQARDGQSPGGTTELANADLSVHVAHARFANGSSHLKRVVTDRRVPIEFELNEKSGGCSVSRAFTGSWQWAFPREKSDRDGEDEKIYLLGVNPDQMGFLMGQIFLETVGADSLAFAPLNKYSDDLGRHVHSSYERELDQMRLTTSLEGPARVVRKFDHVRGQSNRARIALNMRTIVDKANGTSHVVVPYNSISARVFLLSKDKKRVRAILDAKLRQHPAARLSQMLASASVSECFNSPDPAWSRQLAHYTLEYPMREYAMRVMARYYFADMADNLYGNLLKAARLMPLQLDGGARFDLSEHDNLLRVHFSVMEPPTSYLYFNEHLQCAMSERVERASELRIVPNLRECSRWCDQINCLAMSYCDDRTCRVATLRALLGSNETDTSLDLAECQMQNSCAYYYSKRRFRMRTLSSFKDFMRRVVNSPGGASEHLKDFGLTFAIYRQVTPTRFYESSEMFRWQHEAKEDPLYSLPVDSLHSKYAKQASGKILNLANLVDNDKYRELVWSATAHASSIADCLSFCDNSKCLLVSHCAQSLECRTITGNDLTRLIGMLATMKREIFEPSAPECAIFMRDHLDEFEQFDNSLVPSEWSRQLDELSVLECALACQAAGSGCLSFDMCTQSTEAHHQVNADNSAQDAHNYREEEGSDLGVTGTCFLQTSHVTLDSFDRAVLLPAWDAEGAGEGRNKIGNKSVVCGHYSRSLLMSFLRIANKKRRARTSGSIEGIGAERCAADCLQDDQCHAFEHCLNERRWPMQSCSLIREDDFRVLTETGGDEEQQQQEQQDRQIEISLESMSQLVTNSSYCSIYVAKSLALRERLDETFGFTGELAGLESGSSSHGTLLVIVLMLVAILLGASIQFAHIQLTGRPLLAR